MTWDTIKILEAVRELPYSEWEELKTVLLKDCDDREKNALREKQVYELMKELGIPSHIIGYWYVSKAVLICLEDSELMEKGVRKNIYCALSEEFSITVPKVEYAIRQVVQKVFERGNIEVVKKVFGYSYSMGNEKPTNLEFITGIVTYIKKNS